MAQGPAVTRTIDTPAALNDLSDVDTSGQATDDVLTFDGTTWGPAAASGGGSTPLWLDYLNGRVAGETSHADDDFFDDGSLSGDWTTLTTSGSQTITEQYDRLSVEITGTIATSDFNAILRGISPTVGDVIETRIANTMVSEAQDFLFAGLCFSDGVLSSSTVAMFTAFHRIDVVERHGWWLSTRDGTFTAASADTSGADEAIIQPTTDLYMRLEYDAANTFKAFVSPDGITWINPGTSFTTSFTPTHAGLVWSNWGHSADLTVVTFDYFRYNGV